MAVYQFRGRNAQGQLVNGQLEAANTDAAAGLLFGRGVIPLSIDEYRDKPSLNQRWERWSNSGKVEPVDLIMFCRQMYTITRAGIPLVKGIRGLAATLRHLTFKETLEDVADRLEAGQELSAAMRHHPKVFNNLFVSIVNVGENSGQLEAAFLQLSEYMERDQNTIKSIKSALRYPSFVMAALAIAIAVINIWVIPAFGNMFAQFGADLPLPTRILVGVSDFFVTFWPYILVLVVGLAFATRQYVRSEKGSRVWGRKKLRLPVVGDIIERASMARYARSFGLMLRSGLPLNTALNLCAKAIDNPYLGDKIHAIKAGIERGEGLFQTHLASGMFTPLVLQMIAVGEESGQVDRLMTEMAEFYEREVDYDVKKLSDRIEPIMVVIMAGFVLVLALGIFLPMWDMYNIQRS
ncbi:type II secretion system F family protein [Marinimicrobium sp. ABcell2]|uniref:type II secretion system F family protein n=1 Tax=Marinimicrobium sp. ABcell2 TaxID=3069751 RepID=UPI0027B31239|nr:type II secretion system F family protein [Marinimicrobium sp. ABcell2]MDQ2075226.1 type II secretion system F family protein [Marinimicrobium sp. ABcell2]